MNQDSTNPAQPSPRSPFEAAVDAAFEPGTEGATKVPTVDPATVAALRDLIALLREAPVERPSNALRSRAEQLIAPNLGAGHDLASLLKRWLEAARHVAMELVGPPSNGAGLVPSLQPGLAGFRGAAAPIRTYRANTAATPTTPAIEAWLDLQVDPLPHGSRLRGQITCEGDAPPVMVHLFDQAHRAPLASAPIAADGTFVVTTQTAAVTIAIELDHLDTALIVGSVVLRTEQVGG